MVRIMIAWMAVLLLFVGCGSPPPAPPAESPAMDAEEADPAQDDEPIAESRTPRPVDADSDSIPREAPEAAVRLGDEAVLPEDFPEDITVYPNLRLTLVSEGAEGAASYTVAGQTDDTLEAVAQYILEHTEAHGWDEEMTMRQGTDMHLYVFEKEDRTLSVMLVAADGITTVQIETANNG